MQDQIDSAAPTNKNGLGQSNTNSAIQNNYNDNQERKQQKQKIRVLFLGDEGVGKTSIIVTLISDNFPKQI